MDLLVSTQWLADEIGAGDLSVVDATYFLPEAGRDAAAEYEGGHIPGAVYLDLTTLVDADNSLPNTLPTADMFAGRIAALGLGAEGRIILYDNSPHRTAARAWWMFRLFGLANVAILDGGLGRWKAEGRPLETGGSVSRGQPIAPVHRHDAAVRDKDQVAAAIATNSAQILDARSASRFTGEEPEPRPDIASGHMPGARNLPYSHLFDEDGRWKRGDEMASLFTGAGIDLDRPIITTCGSGITAAVLLFGAALLGKADISLYDGSWSEWGADPALPKVTGAA